MITTTQEINYKRNALVDQTMREPTTKESSEIARAVAAEPEFVTSPIAISCWGKLVDATKRNFSTIKLQQPAQMQLIQSIHLHHMSNSTDLKNK